RCGAATCLYISLPPQGKPRRNGTLAFAFFFGGRETNRRSRRIAERRPQAASLLQETSMTTHSWFRKLFAPRTPRPPPAGPRTARRAPAGSRRAPARRPHLEALEDRLVLSSYTAATAGDLIKDIGLANAAGGANTITLSAAPSSPYTLTGVDNTTDGANGLPVIAAGDNLTILGHGDTIERSTTAGTQAFRLFDVAGGGTLDLQNVTLQRGRALVAREAAAG